jgi:hypothetical protein
LDWKWGDGENFGGILNISTTFSVHSPMRILAINVKESEFVDHDTKWWNTGLLKVIFIEDGGDGHLQATIELSQSTK